MALDLRANTAVDVLIGPFVDSTDGNTDETGLTVTQADIRLSKNGQNMAQKNDANACAHDELGYHNCPLNATDTNTEGTLVLAVHEAGALPVRHEYNIMSEAAWDSLYVAKDTGYMDVNIKAVSEDTAAADNLESACDNYSVTRGLTGTALPAVAADGVGGLPISDAGGLDLDTKLANTHEITAARMGALTDWINGGRLDLLLDAIPTTAMRGTDNAALASVLGALNDVAAAGDPTDADTLVQYTKQLINILIGTAGIGIFPAEAAPANAVSLAEVIRAIHVDVTGLNGDAMRGTNSAALASVCTEARLAELAAANLPADVDTLLTRVSAAVALASICTEGRLAELDAANMPTDLSDMKGGTFNSATDSLEAIRDRGDAAWITGAGGSPPTTLQTTTIATLATQISFTLTAGSADDDAYDGCIAVVEDSVTATQKCVGRVSTYTGATKTVTLEADPGVFTMAVGDTIDIIAVEKTWAATTKALTDKAGFSLAVDQGAVTIGTVTTNSDMRGTDNAALAAVCTEGRLAELDAANIPTDLSNIETDTQAIEADTQDIQSRIPAALASGRMSSDAVAISGSTDAADKLEASAETIVIGAAAAGTLSTTQMTTNLTEATNDHYNGRIIIWTSGVLIRQATDITDYAGATKMLTYTAVTEAPGNGDTFVIV